MGTHVLECCRGEEGLALQHFNGVGQWATNPGAC